jgi:hypothetical protein|tara:strand:- start:7286 stop:7606 length:321 start_codon:yes stop_codon:yes gene_type:complete
MGGSSGVQAWVGGWTSGGVGIRERLSTSCKPVFDLVMRLNDGRVSGLRFAARGLPDGDKHIRWCRTKCVILLLPQKEKKLVDGRALLPDRSQTLLGFPAIQHGVKR